MPLTVEKAAIWYKGHLYSVPRPGRHHNVIALISEVTGDMVGIRGRQGFILSDGSFADREEAGQIALAALQPGRDGTTFTRLNWPPDLYSEDLW
jgi:hypothetical protein